MERRQKPGGLKLGLVVIVIIGIVIAAAAFSILVFRSHSASHGVASPDAKLQASLRATLPNEDVKSVYATTDGVAIVTLSMPQPAALPSGETPAQPYANLLFSDHPRLKRVEVYDSNGSQLGVFDPPLRGGGPAVPNKRIERTP